MTRAGLSRLSRRAAVAAAAFTFALVSSRGESGSPAAVLHAQVRDTSRTNPPASAVGTAAIAGIVTDDGGHQPLRRATVTISGGQVSSRVMSTDDAGRFQITGLPAGTYSATVSKPGYVTTYVGSRRPGRAPGLPFAIAEGEHHDLAVSLMRGAVIAGVITDTFGQPVPNARVSVLEMRVVNGGRRLAAALTNGPNTTQTDERGNYRVWGLPGGSYVVSAAPVNLPVNLSIRQITAADLDWARDQMSGRAGAATTPAPDAGHAVGYSTVYYPGVVDPAAAAQVAVGTGEEHTGISFSLQLVPTATVDGTVLGVDGEPVLGNVQVMLAASQSAAGSGALLGPVSTRGTGVDRAGRFTIAGVAPGLYTLTARGSSRPPAPPPAPGVAIGSGSGAPPPPPPPMARMQDLWATVDIGVSGDDVKGLVLSLRPGMTMSGRVVFEGTSPPVTDLTRVRVGLNPVADGGGAFPVQQRASSPDGTFTVTGITPGRYRPSASIVSVAPPPGTPPAPPGQSPWHLTSAIWQGRDLLDVPLEIHPNEDISGVTLVYSDLQTEVSGSIVTGAGAPALGYVVLVFTTDPSLWETGANSRRIRQAGPQPDGTFKITGLPPGTYFVGAATDVDFNDLSDPSFLEQLAAASLKITLTDGAKVVQNLRLK